MSRIYRFLAKKHPSRYRKCTMALGHSARRKLVWLFFAIFLIFGSYLTIKMLGFVIDTKNFRLVKAGGIYVKFTPRNATLYLDGKKYPGTAGFLSNDIYVSGLTPVTHSVSLSLPGYYDWNKEFSLSSGIVASSKDIILWPKTLTPDTSSTDIAAFWLSKNGPILKTKDGTLEFNNEKIAGKVVILSNLDSQYAVTKDGSTYYFVDLGNTSSTFNINAEIATLRQRQLGVSTPIKIKEIISHPFTRTKIIITTNTSVYILDTKKMELEQLLTANKLIAYATSNNDFFTIDSKGVLTISDLLLHTQSEYPVHLSFATGLKDSPDGSNLLITDEEQHLFYYNVDTQALKKMGTQITFYSFSPDSKRALFIGDNGEVDILYLKDYEENVIRKQGDITQFTLTEGENAQSFKWIPFTQNYFLIQAGNELKVEEFDVRSARNIYTLATDTTQFALSDKTLFLLSNDGLLTSQQLDK